jgi:hypothetical protein
LPLANAFEQCIGKHPVRDRAPQGPVPQRRWTRSGETNEWRSDQNDAAHKFGRVGGQTRRNAAPAAMPHHDEALVGRTDLAQHFRDRGCILLRAPRLRGRWRRAEAGEVDGYRRVTGHRAG